MTLERPASLAARAVRMPATAREAHLMPSVVERYGKKRTEDAPRGSDIDPTPAAGRAHPADAPVSVETLQMLIRHLVVDSAFARHMEVSPGKTIKKIPYLTERDRRRLSEVDAEILQSLADAAQRYTRAVGPTQQIGPAGIGKSDDPRARLGGFGEFGSSGGAGWLGDTSRFLPGGRDTGVNVGGREVITGGGGDGQGGSPDNTGGYGGLSRGSLSGLGIPGAASHFGGGGFGAFGDGSGGGDEMGGDGGLGRSLGFLHGMGRGPLGSDPLVNARAYHRLHPGGGASDQPGGDAQPSGSASGGSNPATGYPASPTHGEAVSEKDDPDNPGKVIITYADGTEVGGLDKGHMTPGWVPKEQPHSVWRDVVAGGVVVGALGALVGGGLGLGSGVGPVGGAAIGGITGFAIGGGIGAVVHYTQHKDKQLPPDLLRTTVAGLPASKTREMPAEGGTGPSGPVGPWSRGTVDLYARRPSYLRGDLLPAPDAVGGGPVPHVWMPNPDTGDPGTPRSRATASVSDMVDAVSSLMRASR